MEGGPEKEKNIIGSSAQDFGTDLKTTTVVGSIEILCIDSLRIRCWTPRLRIQVGKDYRPSWMNWTWKYCWTSDLKCCSFPCSS
ncbi:hypothetical protein RclHR1_06590006 [Rhizophagus clarus]|uniref:Uncharacterized protein n=1 Tax=Rhizophagus clarus TaxID=94130 RepID=A0A2Z6RSU8_9GLOM|nr:hypothetical protein RclHR1_06590006 [Rhizophagus clarus]